MSTDTITSVTYHRWLAALGTLPYYFLPVKRDVIETNLALVYGKDLSSSDRKHLTKIVYGNLATLALEVVKNCCLPRFIRKKQFEVRNLHHVEEGLSKGKGVLFLACHLGNWEVGLVNLLAKVPFMHGRTTVIRKDLQPEWFHRFVMKRYLKAGIDILPPDASCLKKVLRKLKNNESVVFVLDQHTSVEAATKTQLFGHDVYTTKGLARVAMQTQAPVVPIFTWRKPNGRLVCEFAEAVPSATMGSREEIIAETTQRYCHAMEVAIRRFPEQWFG